MINFEQNSGEKLGMRERVQAIYLERLKQRGIEEIRSVHYWREEDKDPIPTHHL